MSEPVLKYGKIVCPFCGSEMIWDSDNLSEEVGYEPEGKVVSNYTCSKCGATGEFMEGDGTY